MREKENLNRPMIIENNKPIAKDFMFKRGIQPRIFYERFLIKKPRNRYFPFHVNNTIA